MVHERGSLMAPLGFAKFRNIWLASIFSNLGFLIQSVGAAWAMTELTSRATMVALVQTATMLPVLLIALPAGAIADMYETRMVGISAISLSLTGVAGLLAQALFGSFSEFGLLASCVMVGSGMALFTPVWMASVVDRVPPEALPAGVALNSMSYNLARSVGPAIGGVLVAALGTAAAFAASTLFYLPMLALLAVSKPSKAASRLPPEQLRRALITGARYIMHSPSLWTTIVRATVFGLMGGSVIGLLPLVARELLGTNADMFGTLLGAYGIGAVLGTFLVSHLRKWMTPEAILRTAALALSCSIAIVAISRNELVTTAALVACGASWILSTNTFNIGIQVAAPRWVAGRALATFQAGLWGGSAMGSWGWGLIADKTSVETAILASAGGALLAAALGLRWKLHAPTGGKGLQPEDSPDPDVKVPITGRSGPVVLQVEYWIREDLGQQFYDLMQEIEHSRKRNGAYDWSLARDLVDPELWIERYHCPTWHDYLRHRNRLTTEERALQEKARDFFLEGKTAHIRRLLQRPFEPER